MTTAENIYELVKGMPEEQIGEVLNFMESLQHKSQQTVATPSEPQLLPLRVLEGVVLEGVVPHGWRAQCY